MMPDYLKAIRTPEDDCLICLKNKATKKGSHYTPAGIIKRVIGERDYEELYSITASQTSITTFLGRSNLSNKDPEIKKLDHVDDYIFCPECEKRLGLVESECNNPLLKLSDKLLLNELPLRQTKKRKPVFFF